MGNDDELQGNEGIKKRLIRGIVSDLENFDFSSEQLDFLRKVYALEEGDVCVRPDSVVFDNFRSKHPRSEFFLDIYGGECDFRDAGHFREYLATKGIQEPEEISFDSREGCYFEKYGFCVTFIDAGD